MVGGSHGIDLDRLLVRIARRIKIATLGERGPHIIPGVGKSGPAGERLAVVRDCPFIVGFGLKNVAEII